MKRLLFLKKKKQKDFQFFAAAIEKNQTTHAAPATD
jgi:hypothetical protein